MKMIKAPSEDQKDAIAFIVVLGILISIIGASLYLVSQVMEFSPEEMRENSFYSKCRVYGGSVWEDECVSNQEVIFNLTDFDAVK